MGIYSKSVFAILVLALSCMPALAQQERPGPPPDASQANWGGLGPGRTADPPVGAHHTHVWIDRGQGRGFAVWGRDLDMGGMMGDGSAFGLRGMNGMNIDAQLARAQRLLREPQLRQQLGINDQEANKLENEVTDFRKTLIQDRANLGVQKIDLQNLIAAQNPDRAAVNSKLQQVGTAQLALEKATVDFALTLKQEITPAQRQKIRQLLRHRRRNFGPGNGPAAGGARFGRRNRRRPRPDMSAGRQARPPENAPAPPNSQGGPQGSTPQTPNQ
ncbi:MAG: Spy/CpxP family protein refolding chaperone [Candidatus Acidiferrales bacterium]